MLKRFGFNLQGGKIMYEGLETDWAKLKDKWDVISSIRQEVPVDDDYIYDEFPIPKPDNYEQLKEEMDLKQALKAFQTVPENPLNDEEEDPKADNRKPGVTNLFNRLKRFFA